MATGICFAVVCRWGITRADRAFVRTVADGQKQKFESLQAVAASDWAVSQIARELGSKTRCEIDISGVEEKAFGMPWTQVSGRALSASYELESWPGQI